MVDRNKSAGTGIRKPKSVKRTGFTVAGIGASAGGLESFIQLISNIPVDTGMAFVLVQHLDPKHPSLSVEIISRSTKLKIQEVQDGISIFPNHVYVIPPNHNMVIRNGALILLPRKAVFGQQMAIDFFFQSLAQHEKCGAIGVVLSGTGTDGTVGLRAIKSAGGITFVQDPKSAKYEGMPQNAIAAGVADLILRPKAIARELARIAAHKESPKSDETESLRHIFALLRSHARVDFSGYKRATIIRRIERRMVVQKARSLGSYVACLQQHPEEIKALYDDILINVTDFFRDPDSFEALKEKVFPQIARIKNSGSSIRVWVPGCSTGEEAYSIVISLIEFLDAAGLKIPIQMFATDIDEQAIHKARTGRYSETIAQHVSKKRLARYFDKVDGGFKVQKSIRDLCLFSKHDVTSDPPFAKLDLVSCRNVLIYFDGSLQKRVIPILHYSLQPNGFLWLGKSEAPAGFSQLFALVDKTHKFHSKSNFPTPMNFHFTTHAHVTKTQGVIQEPPALSSAGLDVHREVDKIILSQFAPPSVIVNADAEIIQFRGRSAPFLEPASGQPSTNLFKMARPELLHALHASIQSAKTENKLQKRDGLHLEVDGNHKTVSLEVLPINPQAPLKQRTYLIVFKEAMVPADVVAAKVSARKNHGRAIGDKQIAKLLHELAETKAYQRLLIEQYEAAQEELTATNEELQSANEELQSTNEELETAKEELQSTNEELTTVNDELQTRNTDLTVLGSDLSNLLTSTEIPILIVGSDHRVRRFTPKAKTTFNLIPTDVGRPIGDIKPNFNLDLDALVSEVTKKLRTKVIEIQDSKGNWQRLQIRPYWTTDDKIDGAIIAVVDIEDLKQREIHARKSFEYVTSVAETVPLPLLVLNRELQIMSANRSLYHYLQISAGISGKNVLDVLGLRGEHARHLSDLLSDAMRTNISIDNFEFNFEFSRLGQRIVLVSGKRINWKGNEPAAMLLGLVDVTEQRRLEKERDQLLVLEKKARAEAERANRTKDVFLATLSHELRTPLASILTWAQLIRLGKVNFEKAQQGASVIEQSAKTQSQLIDDLLDISRIVCGKLAMQIQEVDPAAAIQSAVESVRSFAEKKNIQIKTIFDPSAGHILADPVRLKQIIWNLLTNAIKFSPKEGRVKVRLECVSEKTGSFVRITVDDWGSGIDLEFLPHIFNRFSQADSAQNRIHGGLGLGLSIVRSLVELQGGTVRAENRDSDSGSGSVFTVSFPLFSLSKVTITQDDAANKKDTPQDGSNDSKELTNLNALRILLVDDDESAREAIGIYLRSFGAEVMLVGSASEALNSLSKFNPHILVSDIAMPGEDGYDLIRKIRTLSPQDGGNVPSVALTAYATAEDSKRALAAGFQAHVAKPVVANELVKILRKFAKH